MKWYYAPTAENKKPPDWTAPQKLDTQLSKVQFFMSKYSLSFKLEVVQHYLSGLEGQKATAKRFGIDNSAVRKWTALWQLHGEAGLTMRCFTYSPAFKESVILSMREHRLSVREVCAKFWNAS